MTEAEAREILRLGDHDGYEAWLAAEAWIATPKGWRVVGKRDGWNFTLEPVPDGVIVSAFPLGPRSRPAVWVVEAGSGLRPG
jgi:hypothetical protein